MNRWTVVLAAMLTLVLAVLGCSGGGNPVAPTSEPDLTVGAQSHGTGSQTHLWGYYDVYIDIETQSVEYVANRNVMFTANVVQFVNNNPANLGFVINSTPIGTDWVDVDIDVSITHPFPGLTEYNGYDVRGIFIGDASASLSYNGDLDYAVLGTDQFMQDFDGGLDGQIFGNPDGYTRWWNPIEFKTPGVLGYTEGKVATPGYMGNATLNPYKYFADGLTKADDAWEWLNGNPATNGVFAAGAKNTRNYYLRFPNTKGVRYNYAIAANWIDETTHPANTPEAPVISCEVTPDIYWVPPGTDKGGDLILDVRVWGWDEIQPSTIFIESTVLSAVYEFDSNDMTPIGGDANYSTYHAEVAADDITGLDGQEFWVICQYDEYDYTNAFGVTNLAGTDFLAAFFRYDLFVSDTPYNQDPVCDVQVVTPMPYDGWAGLIEFDASGSSDPDGDPLTFEWDFDGDSVFGDAYEAGDDEHPQKYYDSDYVGDVCVKVTDGQGGEAICCVDVDITAHPTKNIDVTYSGAAAVDVAMDHSNGDVLVYYANAGRVRRYTRSSFYTSYNQYNVVSGYEKMDQSPNGYFILGRITGSGTTYYIRSYHYTSTGGYVSYRSAGYGGAPGMYLRDVAAMGSSGSWAQDHVLHCDWYLAATYTFLVSRYWNATSYSSGSQYISYYSQATGPTSLFPHWMKGTEPEDGTYVWHVQGPNNCRVSRWSVSNGYGGAYWGTGSGTDGDNGVYGPLDISKDDQNNFYILDELSTGDFTIKAFAWDGSSVSNLSSFGDDDDWDLDPLRIEGSNYDGMICVLHTSGNDSHLSFFPEDETSG